MNGDPDPLVAYKTFLREAVERRPSGTRQRLASAFGTHPSFISQITNPALRVPLPAQHIPALFHICHLTEDEQTTFLDLYRLAHPSQAAAISELAEGERNVFKIVLPQFDDPATRAEVEAMIRDFAERMIAFAQSLGAGGNKGEKS
jgi:hypothetical protein